MALNLDGLFLPGPLRPMVIKVYEERPEYWDIRDRNLLIMASLSRLGREDPEGAKFVQQEFRRRDEEYRKSENSLDKWLIEHGFKIKYGTKAGTSSSQSV